MNTTKKYKVGLHIMEKNGDNQYEYPDYDPMKNRLWEYFDTIEDAVKKYNEWVIDFYQSQAVGFVIDKDCRPSDYEKYYKEWYWYMENKTVEILLCGTRMEDANGNTLHPPIIEQLF